jgi:thioredoxin 1
MRRLPALCLLLLVVTLGCADAPPPTASREPSPLVSGDTAGEAARHLAMDVTDASFPSEVLSNPQLVLVDFWAAWCPPCRKLEPIIEELAAEFDGRVTVVKLDVDENPETAGEYGIEALPTLILFQDGRPVERVLGYHSKAELAAKLNAVLARET